MSNMTTTDREIGDRIRQARERIGRPQRTLAISMSMLGHKWMQNTLTRVESGDRPLRLTEAEVLAGILGVTVSYLLGSEESSEASALRELRALRDHLDARIGELS